MVIILRRGVLYGETVQLIKLNFPGLFVLHDLLGRLEVKERVFVLCFKGTLSTGGV